MRFRTLPSVIFTKALYHVHKGAKEGVKKIWRPCRFKWTCVVTFTFIITDLTQIFFSSSQCTVGWSDFQLFRFSKMGTLLSIVYIFMSPFLKNRRISPLDKIFIFKKSQRPWKLIIYFENFQNPSFYIKEQFSKI